MARIFITGSSDGLGRLAARSLVAMGHKVIVHGRNQSRANDAMAGAPGSEAVVIGDLSSLAETREVARQVNDLGACDVVIHNAGVGNREPKCIRTVDGFSHIFAVNSLAPYILTCLIQRPKRLIFMSSGLHRSGDSTLEDLNWEQRPWNGNSAYADSKLHNVILAFGVARKWHDVISNALEPGWVPTKMGGAGAPDSLELGAATQVWLATSNDKAALASGGYFYHQKPHSFHAAATDPAVQEKYLSECERLSGVAFTSP